MSITGFLGLSVFVCLLFVFSLTRRRGAFHFVVFVILSLICAAMVVVGIREVKAQKVSAVPK